MEQIFLANPKGGCGKTMMSIHLASYFAHQNRRVALCDHDPQQSALDWLRNRPEKYPTIHGIQCDTQQITGNPFDVVIHDLSVACRIEELSEMIAGNKLVIPPPRPRRCPDTP